MGEKSCQEWDQEYIFLNNSKQTNAEQLGWPIDIPKESLAGKLLGSGGGDLCYKLPSPALASVSLPLLPPGGLCFLGSASRKTTSGLFFFPLSPVNKALSRVALNLLQIAKKWLKVSSSFRTLGAETQGSALARVPNSLQTARKKKKRPTGKEKEKDCPGVRPDPWSFLFSNLFSLCPPALLTCQNYSALLSGVASVSFLGCALGSSLLLNFMRRTGQLWSPPPGKNEFFLFLFIYSFIFVFNCVSITPCSPRREVDNLTLISSRLWFIHDTLVKGNGSPC